MTLPRPASGRVGELRATPAGTRGTLLLALLITSAAPAGAAPGDAGQHAFEARRYAEAREAWTGPAEAGDAKSLLGLAQLAASGRDGPIDLEAAATLLARAAVRGSPRAAYRLARLYAAGSGLPRNPDQAEEWYAVAAEGGVTASPRELAALRRQAPAASAMNGLAPARPVAPADGATLGQMPGAPSVEFVWTAPAQGGPVRFFVEVVAIEANRLREVFAGYSERSAVLAALDQLPGDYAWRVFVVGLDTPAFAASAWSRFRVAPS